MGFKSGIIVGMMLLWGYQHPQKVMTWVKKIHVSVDLPDGAKQAMNKVVEG